MAACLGDGEEEHPAHKLWLGVDAHNISGGGGAGAISDALERGRRLAVLAAHRGLQVHVGEVLSGYQPRRAAAQCQSSGCISGPSVGGI